MDSVIAQIRQLAEKADAAERNKIWESLREVQQDFEPPMEMLLRLFNSQLQVAAIHVGVDLGLFEELVKDPGSVLDITELSRRTKASPALLERLTRYLASTGLMKNVGPNQFSANKATHVFASPLAAAGVVHAFDCCGPAFQAFPSFLAETDYQDITTTTKTPFQKGHHTDLPAFQYLSTQPKLFNALQTVMTAIQSSEWIGTLDVLDQSARADTVAPVPFATDDHHHQQQQGQAEQPQPDSFDAPFFVDVGGGHGHQCKRLLEKYPNLSGRVVLQDLPQAVEKLEPIDGVRAMACDFFQKQPVQGANFYYLRRILHDWPDSDSLKILSNLSAAMSATSRILIDEVVLPDMNAPWQAAMTDLSMAIQLGGKERTRAQWESLVERSGLKLALIHTYNLSLYTSVIVLEGKGREGSKVR